MICDKRCGCAYKIMKMSLCFSSSTSHNFSLKKNWVSNVDETDHFIQLEAFDAEWRVNQVHVRNITSPIVRDLVNTATRNKVDNIIIWNMLLGRVPKEINVPIKCVVCSIIRAWRRCYQETFHNWFMDAEGRKDIFHQQTFLAPDPNFGISCNSLESSRVWWIHNGCDTIFEKYSIPR